MKSSNWREKVGKKQEIGEYSWRLGLQQEFVDFIEEVDILATHYDWNLWGGGVGNYSVGLSQSKKDGKYISIRILPTDNYSYFVSFDKNLNPNNISKSSYQEKIANNIDDALKYLHNFLLENQYILDNKKDRISIMGGAYDRYFLEKLWEDERISEEVV